MDLQNLKFSVFNYLVLKSDTKSDSRPVTSEKKYADRHTHNSITAIHFNIQCNGIRRHGAL